MEGALDAMEVRLSFTVAEHGHDPENGVRAMDAFMDTFPEGGPAVSQNTADGNLTITFALDAQDAKEALERGLDVFAAGMTATGLLLTDVLDIEASVVPAEDSEAVRELAPA